MKSILRNFSILAIAFSTLCTQAAQYQFPVHMPSVELKLINKTNKNLEVEIEQGYGTYDVPIQGEKSTQYAVGLYRQLPRIVRLTTKQQTIALGKGKRLEASIFDIDTGEHVRLSFERKEGAQKMAKATLTNAQLKKIDSSSLNDISQNVQSDEEYLIEVTLAGDDLEKSKVQISAE